MKKSNLFLNIDDSDNEVNSRKYASDSRETNNNENLDREYVLGEKPIHQQSGSVSEASSASASAVSRAAELLSMHEKKLN